MDENQDTRCHSCGARVAAGAEWCTLCYARQRPQNGRDEPQKVPAGQPGWAGAVPPGGRHRAVGPVGPVGAGFAGAVGSGDAAGPTSSWADAPSGPVDAAQAEALADSMLARLAAEAPRIPPMGPLNRSMSTVYGRAGIAALGVAAVMLVVFGLMAMVGSLL